jgi:hypothetical protein
LLADPVFTQLDESRQLIPQAPQLMISVTAMHMYAPSVLPVIGFSSQNLLVAGALLQLHSPALQVAPVSHVTPHFPQSSIGSTEVLPVVRFTHSSPHAVCPAVGHWQLKLPAEPLQVVAGVLHASPQLPQLVVVPSATHAPSHGTRLVLAQ